MATSGAPNFYQALSQVISTEFPGYLPIEGQADFNYNWKGLNDPTQFNANTFTQLNSILQPGPNSSTQVPTLMLTPSQTLSGGWSNLIKQMAYKLSKSDSDTLNTTNEAAETQQAAVIAAYTQSISAITQSMMTAAENAMGIAAPIPFTQFNYVVDYTMCWVWSGYTQNLIAKPLTYMEIQQGIQDSETLFPAMPAGGASVLAPMVDYLSVVNSILGLQSELSNGSANLSTLKQSTQQPSLSNPDTGMITVDSNGQSSKPANAWSIQTSPQAIVNGLGGIPPTMPPSASIQVMIQASQESSNSYTLSINGNTGFTVGDGWLEFTSSVSTSFDMTSSAWAGSSYTVTFQYDYPTTVTGIEPMTYDPDTLNGWFWGFPLQQALANFQADQANPSEAPNNTGYNFLNPPVFDLASGGNFGYINSLLISQYPSITINYENGNFDAYQQQIGESVNGSLRLFGSINLASAGASTQSMTATQNSSGQGFSVTITPPLPSVAVGYYDQTACILAARPVYPGAS